MSFLNARWQEQYLLPFIDSVIIMPRIGQHLVNRGQWGDGMGLFLLGVLTALLPSAAVNSMARVGEWRVFTRFTWRRSPAIVPLNFDGGSSSSLVSSHGDRSFRLRLVYVVTAAGILFARA